MKKNHISKRWVNIQIMPMGGREPAYQKTLKYAVRERGETNWAIPTLQV